MDAISALSSQSSQAASQSRPTQSSDYETFLLMLTTQLQNQDPLDPSKSDELAVQLATFSGVEQQTLTNQLLEDLGAQLSLGTLAQMGNWVGMEVLAQGPVGFSGQPIALELTVPNAADKAELVVFREDGAELQRIKVDPDARNLTWAGVGPDGRPFPPGTYRFGVYATNGDNALSGGSVSAYREVAEVRSDAGATLLIDRAGAVVDAGDVSSLRPAR